MGQGVLSLSPKTLQEIAVAVGTPAYVYDVESIRRQYNELTEAFAEIPHRVYYSVKANSTLAILDLVRSLGAGVDIVSGGELVRSLRAGFAPNDIVFSGVGKTAAELEDAVETGIGLVNVESSGELELLDELAGSREIMCNVGIRVNPDVVTKSHPYVRTGHQGLKFGVPIEDAADLARRVASSRFLRLRSVGMHIGSQVTEAGPYREGAERLVELVRCMGPVARDLEFVSVGGGLGIHYTDEQALGAAEFVAAVRPLWEALAIPIAVEPGRFLVGNAGSLLMTCLYTKRSGNVQFVIVDTGMNDFLRPSLYGAKHAIRVIVPASADKAIDGNSPVHVVGPICESGDAFGSYTELSGVGPGAILALLGAGAYGFSMSSAYNSRPRAPEVLVQTDEWSVIRDRESADDLMRGERVPRASSDDRVPDE